eukprot:scaffold126074_cov19-Tisochrysis_lutea.AAC.1
MTRTLTGMTNAPAIMAWTSMQLARLAVNMVRTSSQPQSMASRRGRVAMMSTGTSRIAWTDGVHMASDGWSLGLSLSTERAGFVPDGS